MKLKNTSVTQMEKFHDCPRKWYFDKVVGLPAPKSPSAERGILGHEAIEVDAVAVSKTLTERLGPPAAGPFERYVEVARRYGPQPGEPAGIEISISMPTAPGLPPLIGKVDVFLYDRDPIRIIDWKFISDARYAKTETELYDDLQTNVYTEWVYQEIERRGHEHNVVVPDSVNIGLVYFVVGKNPAKVPKKGPKHLPVFVDLSRKNTARVWQGAIETTRKMVGVAEIPTKDEVKPNPLACTKYGGCPYRAQCGLPVFSGFSTATNKGAIDVNFYQQMQEKGLVPANGQNGAGVPAQPPQTAPQPQQQPPPQTQGWGPPAAGAAAPPQTQGWGPPAAGAAAAPPPQTQGWNPGGAAAAPPPPPQTQGWGAPAAGAAAPPQTQGWGAPAAAAPQGAQGILSPDAPPRETGAEADPAPPGAAPEKKTRKKKGAADPQPGAFERGVAAEEAASSPAPLAAPVTHAQGDGFELYVDCYPVKTPYGAGGTNFDDWIAPVVKKMNEIVAQPAPAGKGLPDFRLLPYSEEKAFFTLGLVQWIEQRGLPPSLVVMSSSPLSRDALAILTPYATSVVRAIR